MSTFNNKIINEYPCSTVTAIVIVIRKTDGDSVIKIYYNYYKIIYHIMLIYIYIYI